MEVGEEGDYITYRYTVTTRMTHALRGAAMRTILMFTTTFEEKGEPKRIRTEAPPLTSLTPYH